MEEAGLTLRMFLLITTSVCVHLKQLVFNSTNLTDVFFFTKSYVYITGSHSLEKRGSVLFIIYTIVTGTTIGW